MVMLVFYHCRVSTSKNSVTLTVDPETVAKGAIAQANEQLSKFCVVTSTQLRLPLLVALTPGFGLMFG